MAYSKQEWKDGEDGDTPITAKALNHIETGIADKAEKGDKGDTGDDGKDGSDGDKGDTGDDGSDGSDGADGRGVDSIEYDSDEDELVFKMTEGDDIRISWPESSS